MLLLGSVTFELQDRRKLIKLLICERRKKTKLCRIMVHVRILNQRKRDIVQIRSAIEPFSDTPEGGWVQEKGRSKLCAEECVVQKTMKNVRGKADWEKVNVESSEKGRGEDGG